MKCFSEELLQIYIDGECSKEELIIINKHLRKCDECSNSVIEARKRSETIKNRINRLAGEIREIPVFRGIPEQKKLLLSKQKKQIYVLSAACILLVAALGIYHWESPTHQKSTIYYSIEYEIDANKPLADQEMVMYITSENAGEIENEIIEM